MIRVKPGDKNLVALLNFNFRDVRVTDDSVDKTTPGFNHARGCGKVS